jgi:hypothetical protein
MVTKHILEYTESEPFKEVPAVSVSAIRVMTAIKFPFLTSDVLIDSLPVAFTLIDSYNECHQVFGAALLLNMLTESTPTCFVSLPTDEDCKINTNCETKNFQNTLKVLSLSCRTCKHVLSFYLLTKARFKLFQMAPHKEANKLRRDAVYETFQWIQKNSYTGPGADPESLELLCVCLVTCLQPLLHELAQLPDAAAMELGRAGLIVLLPLIRWDSNNLWPRKVQVAAMECLLSLMMGAYPIMERHGGKIMSELISCVGRLQRDVVIHEKVHNAREDDDNDELLLAMKMTMVVAMHVASASLVLCGQRAEEVLIEIERGSYITTLVDACSLVRSNAAIMTSNKNG